MYLIGFPLLVVPFAVYNIIEFVMPGATPGAMWTNEIGRLRLASGADWVVTVGDVLISVSILILFLEMLKATRLSSRTIVDHLLSTVLFIVMLIEFLLVRQAATATFFLLLVIAFVDVVGGFTITIRTSQRDISIDGNNHISRV
jgi:hypothetical protein